LQSVQRQTGQVPKELLDLKEMPDIFINIWKDFRALDADRSSNGYSPNPLGYEKIQAYFSLLKQDVQPWEVETIKYFDTALLNCYAEKAERDRNTK
jgi:hypothetical protein